MDKGQLTKILVVENEGIVAMHLKNMLKSLGYAVSAVVFSGEEAIKKAAETHPDLVLMDIRLNGEMDGIEAAEQIRVRFNIPVVYLTAYTDDETLQRAKVTEPFGYIVKPFEERELQSNIDIALYRHKMEMRLKDREQWLAVILKSIGDAVIATDARGLVTFMNSVAEALTDWKQGDVSGKDLKEVFSIINKERHNVTESPVMKTIWEGVVIDLSNYILLLTRNGAERTIEGSIAPLRDDKGDITGAVLVFRDITQRKVLEGQLLQAQKMEAIGGLTAGLAHDFNNLLTSVISYSSFLLESMDKDDPMRQDIEEIKKAGKRAASLTGQLLAFSRKQVLQPKVLDLNVLITNIEKMLRRLIEENVELEMVLEQEPGKVEVDPGQMEQAIMNLSINARDAMPQGGKLIIETANVDLDEAYAHSHLTVQPGPYVMLVVSDTGTGMDQETRSHIFEPFFTTKEKGVGTGLGLSTVYGIVKQSNGYIWVYSEPGQGSTFKVYLPRVEKDEEVEKEQVSMDSLSGSETILVVEDDEEVLNLEQRIIKGHGYSVLKAQDGEEAMRVGEQHDGPIHLMVTDVVMPKMSGKELAEQLRSLYPEMKVLYISGYTDNIIFHHGVLDTGAAFLQKPFTPEVLAGKVREMLDQR